MTDPKTTFDTDIDGAADGWRFVDEARVDVGPGPLVWTEPTPPAVRVAVTHDGLIHVQINGTPVDEAARLWLDAVLGEVRHRNAGLLGHTRAEPRIHPLTRLDALFFAVVSPDGRLVNVLLANSLADAEAVKKSLFSHGNPESLRLFPAELHWNEGGGNG